MPSRPENPSAASATPTSTTNVKAVALRPSTAAQDDQPLGELYDGELFWRDHYNWLKDLGYVLRRRYEPDWAPSWKGTKRSWDQCEDGQDVNLTHLLDATRVAGNVFVVLKKVSKSWHPYEAAIGQFFSSGELASDPLNHCVPVYETLQVPDDDSRVLIPMLLLRKYNNPGFDTIGEAVDFFQQAFDGLNFMHKHHVAHRDCNGSNIMMDARPLYPESYHPVKTDKTRDFQGNAKHFTRTQKPPRYYFVDFGLSRRYDPSSGPPLEDIILGGDKSAPEHRDPTGKCNPFPTDVYYIGNMVREDFIKKKFGFDFMEPLVADMVQEDPSKRPTMDEVVVRFEKIRGSLSTWTLRSRIADRKEFFVKGIFRSIGHWKRRTSYILTHTPAIPSPPPPAAPSNVAGEASPPAPTSSAPNTSLPAPVSPHLGAAPAVSSSPALPASPIAPASPPSPAPSAPVVVTPPSPEPLSHPDTTVGA